MKYYEVVARVTIEVTMELEDEDGVADPRGLVRETLKEVSVGDWYRRLKADWEIVNIDVPTCEVGGQTCNECGTKLTVEQWPEGTSCPVCDPYSGE